MLLGALIYRKLRQRRAARALRIDSPTGIVEEQFVRLGGIEQWVSIRGEDRSNPVLLVLHGGPGSTYTIFTPHLRAWEKHFTVVQWDRRGVGKTLGRTGKRGSGDMTFARMADDGIELVEHLCARLEQEKIVLLSSSMGTLVGLPMAKRRPDLFHAWVATDVNVGDVAGHARYADYRAWTKEMQRLAGTVRVEPRFTRFLMSSMFWSPGHSLRDLSHVIAGLSFSSEKLFEELKTWDAFAQGTRFELPVLVFVGDSDVFTPTARVRQWFDQVEAPLKRFALVENAGHLAAFGKPQQFLSLLLEHVRVSPPAAAAATSAPSPRHTALRANRRCR